MATPRIERLVDLIAALLNAQRPLTRDEIEERVPGYDGSTDSRRRAFERDKEVLRSMGIPLTTEAADPAYPDRGDGYRIHKEEYGLPDPGLTNDELAALHLAASLVRVEGGEAVAAIWKLGGTPTGDAAVEAMVSLPGSAHMETLWAAAAEGRPVTFGYKGGTRSLEPWRVEFRNGRWYVTGLDRDRGARRSFRLDRMEGAVSTGAPKSFERPEGDHRSNLSRAWEMGDGEPVEATVLIDADQARFAERLTGRDAVVERREDGAVVVRLNVANVAAFRSFVFGFLDRAEVLGPEELRSDLMGWLTEMADG